MYFTRFLQWSDNNATIMFHVFVLMSYLTSVLGGALADSRLGKFKTILYFSIVYAIGNCVMSGTAIPRVTGDPPQAWGAIIGLICIALGAGGIKPCVAAFGGDQLKDTDEELLRV